VIENLAENALAEKVERVVGVAERFMADPRDVSPSEVTEAKALLPSMRHYERVLAPIRGLRVLRPYGKNHRSRRRVPLTGRALEALAQSPPRLGTTLLFPAPQGGYLALDNWRNRVWYPALDAAGITKRGPYHLRHTFATEALAGGISTFELSRLMGTSIAMIDRHYGHLARDLRTRSGHGWTPDPIVLAFIWRPTPSERLPLLAATPHGDRDRG